MTRDLNDFIDRELYPALYENINFAFPGMEFRRIRQNWESPYKLNGERREQGKTVVWEGSPYCVKEWGGEVITLINFRMRLTGDTFIEAVRYLAGVCYLSLPQGDSEAYRVTEKRRSEREELLSKCEKALFSEEGKETLDYLKGRGWTEEEIKEAELGYLAPSLREGYSADKLPPERYRLLIPYRSGGFLIGFKIRDIHTDEPKEKYRNTEGLEKRGNLFNLPGLRAKDGETNLTIVEGELDALHARVKGVKNIVASAGLDISEEAIEKAKEKGFQTITILVEHDNTETKNNNKLENGIAKAVKIIYSVGLTPILAFLPGDEGEKVDTDSFLKDHTREDLEVIIADGKNAIQYLFNYQTRKISEGDIKERDYTKEKYKLAEFVEEYNLNSEDRERVLYTFSGIFGEVVSPESLDEFVTRLEVEKAEKKQKKELERLLATAKAQLEEGDTAGVFDILSKKLETIRSISEEEEFRKQSRADNPEEIKEGIKKRPQGIETKYIFHDEKGKESEVMTLPIGAITLITALPSHCKTAFLRNLALQILQDEKVRGSVLYYSYEIDKGSTYMNLLNTLQGKALHTPTARHNNLTAIQSYYREGKNYITNEAFPGFQKAEEKLDSWLRSQRLKIFDEDYFSDKLCSHIRYMCKSMPEGVSAIFIDYAQLIYKEGNRLQRNEELKMITKSLREVAKANKIPIIMACQLNRQVDDPLSWSIQNIADSADLEREANLIVLLWNSSFELSPTSLKETNNINTIIKKVGEKFGFDWSKENKEKYILAELGKNRDGERGFIGKFKFTGLTGRIEPEGIQPKEEKHHF